HMMLAAGLAAVRGVLSRVFAPFRSLAKGSVDQRPRPVDLIGTIEFGEQQGMEFLPDTSLVPEVEVVPAGLATAAAEVGGQLVPGDAGLEDEENAREDLAVVQWFAPREAETARGRRRQQRLDLFPEFIGDQRFHGNC